MSYSAERHYETQVDDMRDDAEADFPRPHSVREADLRRRLDAVREMMLGHSATGADSLRTLDAVRALVESARHRAARRTISVRLCACGADARADFAICDSSYCQRRAMEGNSYDDDVGKPGRDY